MVQCMVGEGRQTGVKIDSDMSLTIYDLLLSFIIV
jgi:hypothetical protein